MKTRIAASVAAGAFALAFASAQAADMPKTMTWTAYDTGASGHAQAVAIGNMLKEHYDVALRVLPGKNDVSRMAPLKENKADFCACGGASYYGQEGVFLFAKSDWGPQPLRVIMTAIAGNGLVVGTAADANIKTAADFKGKRIAWVTAGDALNLGLEAYMAFGGVTWNDVEKVVVSGNAAQYDAMINNQLDAIFMNSVTPLGQKIAASPRGLYFPPLPHDDAEGWKRLMGVAPYFIKRKVTTAIGLKDGESFEAATYPYPILVSNADMSGDTVYALTQALVEKFDTYKDNAPGAEGWGIDQQAFQWAIPYHDGAVKYFKEIGKWTAADQAHNDGLVARQGVLLKAWADFKAAGEVPEAEFEAKWMAARAAALEAAGMPAIFK